MARPSSEDLIAATAGTLTGESGLALDVDYVNAPGGYRELGVAPMHPPPGYSFGIGFSWTSRQVEALFRPDRFAGQLVRDLGDQVATFPEAWLGVLTDAAEAEVDVEVVINSERVSPAEAPAVEEWRSAEFVCSRRFDRRPTRDELHLEDALLAVGRSGLGLVLAGLSLEEIEPSPGSVTEGDTRAVTTTRYERSPLHRMRCINHFGWNCQVCELDFEDFYGPLGASFIEVHHLTPVSALGGATEVDPLADLIPLCSNCHSMVHRENPPVTPDELRRAIGRLDRKAASEAGGIIQ